VNNRLVNIFSSGGDIGIGINNPSKRLNIKANKNLDGIAITSEYQFPTVTIRNFWWDKTYTPNFITFAARGTESTPSFLWAWDPIWAFIARSFLHPTSEWSIYIYSAWETTTSSPTVMSFSTTKTWSIVAAENLRIDENGDTTVRWKLFGAAKDSATGNGLRVCSGISDALWQQYGNGNPCGIYKDIDTSSCNFTSTPMYFTSLKGNSDNWMVTWPTSVYFSSPSSFRIYLNRAWCGYTDGVTLVNYALTYDWKIQWMAVWQ
jgi:hypothetical protein